MRILQGVDWWARKRDDADPQIRLLLDSVLAQDEAVTPRLEPYASGDQGGTNDA